MMEPLAGIVGDKFDIDALHLIDNQRIFKNPQIRRQGRVDLEDFPAWEDKAVALLNSLIDGAGI